MLINNSRLFSDFFTKADKQRVIKHIVLHHIGGYDHLFKKNITNLEQAVQALCRYQVSAHYIIDVSGQIWQLVKEADIAYHAGHSYWRGQEGLNSSAIGIEFINIDPFNKQFTKAQIKAGISLCQELIKRYNIKAYNIVGHSDIAYFNDNEENRKSQRVNHLNRKDDPSHLFAWQLLAENNVGIWPQISQSLKNSQQILLKLGDNKPQVKELKERLNNFGYKIANFDNVFDKQLNSVITVFKRRFAVEAFLKEDNSWTVELEAKLLALLE